MLKKIELEPGEEILSVVRKHWFVIFSELIGSLIMILVPIFALILFALIPKNPEVMIILTEHIDLLAFVLCIWLIFNLLIGFMIWTHYYLDLWLVTDRRIIVIDQVHFFNRKVSSFRLERLQDVKVVINGIIPTFLNYGTLHAHTASGNTEENFTTSGLPDPRGLQANIQKATDLRLTEIGQMSHLNL